LGTGFKHLSRGKENAMTRMKQSRYIKLIFLGTIISGIILVGISFHLSQAFITPVIVFIFLIIGATALWKNANKNADGSEWWQDNESSGWRDY